MSHPAQKSQLIRKDGELHVGEGKFEGESNYLASYNGKEPGARA